MATPGTREVVVPAGRLELPGFLQLPTDPVGMVVFAHGSGSGRFSPRNRFVAARLADRGLGSLLLDLLDPSEADIRARVFDIPLLAERLASGVGFVDGDPECRWLPIGLFGASTGAAAALVLASRSPDRIGAVVSRGGRPDLAGEALARVRCPTLLIVGGSDLPVIPLNEAARAMLGGPSELAIVPGATHLFEEPGTLEKVAGLAGEWFARHLAPNEGSGAATHRESDSRPDG